MFFSRILLSREFVGFSCFSSDIILINSLQLRCFCLRYLGSSQWFTNLCWGHQVIRTSAFCFLQILTLQWYIRAQPQHSTYGRLYCCSAQFTIFSLFFDDETASSTQSAYLSLLPTVRKCWQQMQGSIMTLQQHLTDAC